MGHDVSQWLGIIGGICGLVVLLAGLVVAARGSYNKARIASLREDLEDSRNREQDRQGEIDATKNKLGVCEAKIEGLLRENVVLKDLVTQRVEFSALQGLLEMQKQEITSLRASIEQTRQAELRELKSFMRKELERQGAELAGLLKREKESGTDGTS